MVNAVVAGMGSAVPQQATQGEVWDRFFAQHYKDVPLAEKIWHNVDVETRHGVIVPWEEDVHTWGTGARMERFVDEALPLGAEAVSKALASAGVQAADVDQFTVVSCTGYATPGLDILLARDLGMPSTVQRLHVGHMGCYAAVPGLATVSDAAAARSKTTVMLCLELSSLHVQQATDDLSQVVAHALFADAAAALVVRPGTSGLVVQDVEARTDVSTAGHMRWDVTDHGFRMSLSPEVPNVLDQHVGSVVTDLLARNGLRPSDVAGWAVHPGGPKILDVVADRLDLEESDLSASRATLAKYGNCSSATVLLVLERMLQQRSFEPGDPVILMSFGPGLTLYVALLRQS